MQRNAPSITARLIPLLAAILLPSTAGAQTALTPAQIYAKVAPAMVAVQFTWDSERGRQDLVGIGIVCDAAGTILLPLVMANPGLPDDQMKDWKVYIPREGKDPDEVPATFLGRDERNGVAFVRTTENKNRPFVTFTDLPTDVGQTVYSVGVLPKSGGYRPYLTTAMISARLAGETPTRLVAGPLGNFGAIVLNDQAQPIGYVNAQAEGSVFLSDPRGGLTFLNSPPKFFVPTYDFIGAFKTYPKPGEATKLPWSGITRLSGLSKDVAEVFGLTGTVAAEIGEVIPGTAAEKAGLRKGMIITQFMGKPLDGGDEPDDIGPTLSRAISRLNVGEDVNFTVITAKGEAPKTFTVKLDERPPTPSTAKRFFADDLGFSVRDSVFVDTYRRKLAADAKGLVVVFIREQSAAAAAKLAPNDMITEMNGQPVTTAETFKTAYEAARKAKPKEAVVIQVLREGATEVIRIEPPQ